MKVHIYDGATNMSVCGRRWVVGAPWAGIGTGVYIPTCKRCLRSRSRKQRRAK